MRHVSRATSFFSTVASLAVVFLGVASPAAAQQAPQQASSAAPAALTPAELAQPMPIDSGVIIGTLPNGLRYYIRKTIAPSHRAALRLVVRAGSLQEDDDQRGLAHLVEHMQFNGSPHFPNKGDLVTYLESIGLNFGADLNAETDFDHTTYMLTVPTSDPAEFARGFDVLQDWAGHATFTEANVEAERKVVLEEWRRGLGVNDRIRTQAAPVLLQGSRYAMRSPIGDTATIKSATLAPLQRFYHDWYRPDLMAVIACGDFDPAQVEQWIKARFSGLTNPAPERPLVAYHIPDNSAPIVSIVADTELTGISVTTQYQLPFAWKAQTVGDFRRTMVDQIFTTVLQERLADLGFAATPPFLTASAAFGDAPDRRGTFTVTVSAENGQLTSGLEAALSEVERLARFGLTAPQLKKYTDLVLRSANDQAIHAAEGSALAYAPAYVNAFLSGVEYPSAAQAYALTKRVAPTITSQDIMQAAAIVRQSQDLSVSVTLPKANNILVPDTASLLAVFDDVTHIRLAPYVDRVEASTFMEHPPAAGGRIVSTRQVGGGVTEWMLSNGIRVLVKPSTNAPGTVALSGRGPIGYAAFIKPGDSPVPAVLAGQVVGGGGFANFRQAEVSHILIDHHVQAHFLVDEQSTLLGGNGHVDGLETILQAIYLQVTQPGLDESWSKYLKSNMEYKATLKGHSVQDELQDTMKLTMASDNPLIRATVISPATIAAFDPVKSLADVKAIFKDMSQWDFIIVGDVHLDTLAPLIARYLGALPGHPVGPHIDASKRVPIDLGIRAPSGIVQKTLQADLVPRTTTVFVFHGTAPFTRKGDYDMAALVNILKSRLIEKLRMQMNGTYDVDVKEEFAHAPTPVSTYKVTISYSCDPARADDLAQAMFGVIDSLQKTPPTELEMSTLRRQAINALEENAKNDAGLMSDLEEYNAEGWSFDLIGTDLDIVNAWTASDVSAAARLYLNTKQYVRFNVVPKPIELGE